MSTLGKYYLPSGRDICELTGSWEGLYIPKDMVTMAADFLFAKKDYIEEEAIM